MLSTVHSAKGLEWPIVHVIAPGRRRVPVGHGACPRSAGLVEEQRLFYVAVTRAADELSLYAPLRMPHHRRARDDKHSFAPISRFLDDAALATVEVVDLTPPRPAAGADPAGVTARTARASCPTWTTSGRDPHPAGRPPSPARINNAAPPARISKRASPRADQQRRRG